MQQHMTFIDVCAGIGGISLGLERAGMTCIGQIEIDDYCTEILKKHWPIVPRWRDITTISTTSLPPSDVITGGYPCQPFSVAGKRKGAKDDRHLWPFVCGIVASVRPAWCLFENVAGHVSLGLDTVLSDLESLGYASQPLIVPACAVDAPHRRDRVWILAHADGFRWTQRGTEPERRTGEPLSVCGCPPLANSESASLWTGLFPKDETGEWWRRFDHGGGQEREREREREREALFRRQRRPRKPRTRRFHLRKQRGTTWPDI